MASDTDIAMRAACECGRCVVEFKEAPKVRLNCHCTICQEFTASPFSDVVVIPAYRARLRGEDSIVFRKYRRFRFPPPNLSRGRCKHCGQAFVETWGVANTPVLLFVRAVWINHPELLPVPESHLFYEHHVKDMDDGIPRHEGYFASEWSMARMIVHSF